MLSDLQDSHVFGIDLTTIPWQDGPVIASFSLPYSRFFISFINRRLLQTFASARLRGQSVAVHNGPRPCITARAVLLNIQLELKMPSLTRAVPALVLGTLFLVLAFVAGWEIGSLLVALLALTLVAFGVVTALAVFLPVGQSWFYPMAFSLPTLLIGLIAVGDNFTFLSIGLAVLGAGLASEHFARGRARR